MGKSMQYHERKCLFPVLDLIGSRPEVEHVTLQKLRVNSIHLQSFMGIGSRVSEKLVRDTKKQHLDDFRSNHVTYQLITRSKHD